MDTIALKKSKENALKKRMKTIKKGIKAGRINVDENFKKKNIKKKKVFKRDSGIIYLGHIPKGFFEEEMTSYFSQFGKVNAVVLARSKKTGRSKGYGFVEFKEEEVAKIAAETMNNYLMCNRLLKSRCIPVEERKQKLQVSDITPLNYPKKENRKLNMIKKCTAMSKLTQASQLKKANKKIKSIQKFFEDKGIDFEFKLRNDSEKVNKDDNNSENEDQSRVLEIDESDNEIQFKTPPQVKKVMKKASGSSIKASPQSTLSKSKRKKKKEVMKKTTTKSNNKTVNKPKTIAGKKLKRESEENKRLTARDDAARTKSNGIGKKFEKTTEGKKKTLVKSLKPNKTRNLKNKTLERGVKAFIGTTDAKMVNIGKKKKGKSVSRSLGAEASKIITSKKKTKGKK